MKISKYIVLSGVLAFGLTSCSDWLDCNTDPDSPNNESILIENRLPWIQKEFTYAAGCANTRTFATCGGFYSNNANMYNVSVTWDGVNATGLTTTPYQTFFCGTSSNIPDLYNKAMKEGAYHYAGAAKVMHALGFMLMADLYGEIPYTEANTANAAPAYDNGITIWEGCLAEIDEALELFAKPQDASATSLAMGDIWNGGDINKWIKLCYGLKARWLLRVTKNSDHYDADAILAAVAKGPASVNDDTYQLCFDEKGDKTDFLIGDPIMTNGNWDTAAYGKTQWFSKYYLDLLTNLRGAGVEDPRADVIIPKSMTNIVIKDGKVASYQWRRAVGVDMFGNAERLVAGGGNNIQVQTLALADKTMEYVFEGDNASKQAAFVAGVKSNGYTEVSGKPEGRQFKNEAGKVTVCYPAGAWYVNHANFVYAGDTAYVNINGGSQNTNNGTWGMPTNDTYYHSNEKAAAIAGAVSGTGSFQIYPQSDFEVVTYSEMCFIKAEILMRKGDAAGALAAYKDGIKANFDRMQITLNRWKGTYENPNMQPMDAAKISAYMASNAVCQSAGQLKMQDIMLQKYIAMGWSMENWVDMRRFNYSAGNVGNFGVVYPNYGRTKLFNSPNTFASSDPQNVRYWFRRWRLPGSLELNYNVRQALAINAHALDKDIWSMPVFWDCASDAEYLNYLK